MANYQTIITLEQGKRGGKPCVRGLRITVQDVLEWLASGMEVADIIADYPELSKEDIMACLAYTADNLPTKQPAAAIDPEVAEFEQALLRSVAQASQGEGLITTLDHAGGGKVPAG